MLTAREVQGFLRQFEPLREVEVTERSQIIQAPWLVRLSGSLNIYGEPAESWRAKALVGTPEQVCEKIQAYLDAGCTGFIPWCPDYPSTETLELFATKVMPNFR